MDQQRVQAIRDRLDAATPGPWGTYKDATLDGTIVWRIGSNATGEDIGTVIHNRDLDAWLVANAPTDLADLLAEREKLLARNEVITTEDTALLSENRLLLAVVEAVERRMRAPSWSAEVVHAQNDLSAAVRAYRAATTGEAGQ